MSFDNEMSNEFPQKLKSNLFQKYEFKHGYIVYLFAYFRMLKEE